MMIFFQVLRFRKCPVQSRKEKEEEEEEI